MANKNENGFVMIPETNTEFYAKNKSFNILHLYIVERVRSWENNGKACYMSNKQFAEETGNSERTITRAIQLLIDEQVLSADYHYVTDEDSVKKQRVLRIHNYTGRQNDTCTQKTDRQIDKKRQTKCQPKVDKMTTSDRQNGALVNNKKIKENNSLDKVANAPSEEKRDLLLLSDFELNCIIMALDKGERYLDIQRTYNLGVMVTKDTKRECQIILRDRAFDAQQKREAQERASMQKIDYKRVSAQAEAHSACMQDNTEIVQDSILGSWEVIEL